MRKTGLDFTPEGAPSLSRRALARQGGEFDSDRKYPGSEVKVPTLPQRTRQGWRTRFFVCERVGDHDCERDGLPSTPRHQVSR